jgi:hypothetical protein
MARLVDGKENGTRLVGPQKPMSITQLYIVAAVVVALTAGYIAAVAYFGTLF